MRELDIVIVSYNSAEWLIPCLSSVFAHAREIDLQVVVVDNDSTDGSAELVEQNFPSARVIRCQNRGFAAGNNAGLAVTDAPFVLFLNPDTEILEGTFRELLTLFDERPQVGIVGCRQVGTDSELQPTIRRFPTAVRYLCEAFGSERLGLSAPWAGERVLAMEPYERETPCDWVSGSFLLARAEALRAAGSFDERYFLYSEEPDLCVGVKALGWSVVYVPSMTIRHHAGKAGVDDRLIAQDAYARRQYMMKHMSPAERRVSIAAFGLGHALRAVHPMSDKARRLAAWRAILTLLGRLPPPFGPSVGTLRSGEMRVPRV